MPRKRTVANIGTVPVNGLSRLRAAVRGKAAKNESLQANVAAFRGAIGDLKGEVEGLKRSDGAFRKELSMINMRPLRRHSRRLANIADRWTAMEKHRNRNGLVQAA